jgi:hypothetical protein
MGPFENKLLSLIDNFEAISDAPATIPRFASTSSEIAKVQCFDPAKVAVAFQRRKSRKLILSPKTSVDLACVLSMVTIVFLNSSGWSNIV